MSWLTGIAVYVVIWWTALFVVLPWGVRSPSVPDTGHSGGAPDNPRLFLKCLVTTVLSAIIWIMVWLFLKANIIDFYALSSTMLEEDGLR